MNSYWPAALLLLLVLLLMLLSRAVERLYISGTGEECGDLSD